MPTDVSAMTRKYRTATTAEFPDTLSLGLKKEADLKYGENPNQPAAVYRFAGSDLAEYTNIRLAKTGKGGISATNFMDVCRAMDILKFFERPSVAVMKHNIPSGFATANLHLVYDGLASLYRQARDADRRSAYGSIVVFNKKVDEETAKEILKTYVEGVASPDYEEGAMALLEGKADLRVMLFSNLDRLPRFIGEDTQGLYDMKVLPTGRVIAQKPYLTSIRTAGDLVLDGSVKDNEGNVHAVEKRPELVTLEDMLTAWYVNFGVRSNGVVFVSGGVTVSVGSGQQERVGAVEQAIVKAYQKAADREGISYNALNGIYEIRGKVDPLDNAVCSSDAFFPFRDSVDIMTSVGAESLGSVGIRGIIQPGGSKKDYEVIDAANEHLIPVAFTLERCFGHF